METVVLPMRALFRDPTHQRALFTLWHAPHGLPHHGVTGDLRRGEATMAEQLVPMLANSLPNLHNVGDGPFERRQLVELPIE